MHIKVINEFFSELGQLHEYAILHNIDKIYSQEDDIDFIVSCNQRTIVKFVNDFVQERKLSLFNCYLIDLNILRFDILIKTQEEIIKIELDCCCTNKGDDLLGIDSTTLLRSKEIVCVQGNSFYKIANSDEAYYYLKKKAFKKSSILDNEKYFQSLIPTITRLKLLEMYEVQICYFKSIKFKMKYIRNKFKVILDRYYTQRVTTVAFLGPDGAGKSTIIDKLIADDIFINKYYFHLKPIINKNNSNKNVNDPHNQKEYSTFKSTLKLIYFVIIYNCGWLKNVYFKKLKSAPVIVFDRYFDDIFVDRKRYRISQNVKCATFFKKLIPSPDITFVLSADPAVIYKRKQEVTYDELKRQTQAYHELGKGKGFINIDVNNTPEDIYNSIKEVLMEVNNDENNRK